MKVLLFLFLITYGVCRAGEPVMPWIIPLLEPTIAIQASSATGILDGKKRGVIDCAVEGKVSFPEHIQTKVAFSVGRIDSAEALFEKSFLPKCYLQIQKQVCSDIAPISPKPVAISCIVDGTLMSSRRAKIEGLSDRNQIQMGFGLLIGKHIFLRKADQYVQISGIAHCSKGDAYSLICRYGVASSISLHQRLLFFASFDRQFYYNKRGSLLKKNHSFSITANCLCTKAKDYFSFYYTYRRYSSSRRSFSYGIGYTIPISL